MIIRAILPVLLCSACFAANIPAGVELHVRLQSKVASNASKPGDAVSSVIIAPVVVDGAVALHAGVRLHGEVKFAKLSKGPEDRATLEIVFNRMEDSTGQHVKIQSRVSEVDNARESVDEQGRINGIIASQTISARMDQGIGRVAQRSSGLAGFLGLVKGAVLKEADADIVYEPGVEMNVTLTAPVEWKGTGAGPNLVPIADTGALNRLVNSQPYQTRAEKPPKPSDITNLMLIGTEEEIREAFKAAGWFTAAALNSLSALETFRAIAESRGYNEAPMSILLLADQKAAMDFQKQNNTFAMRHHLRVWRRPDTFQGKPVWVVAATHDIGIELSPEQRTFIHKIDSNIDRERAKVVSDLLFTGKVRSLALVQRPDVPRETKNATGDTVVTDAAMAVLVF
ncbi:MAG: LssY C-terminal domain-containing protein [Bryobacteraceae bacterium]|nr:LssY C-terminal domain-containing protein [Bryobacterales bacterium]MEB2360673.1 LssY C-terminal domain-containing protein [Bryobacterales bacterium]NUN03225.1 LssY C-terminal domain-containing protein [Bryobacteraceae bacterium]